MINFQMARQMKARAVVMHQSLTHGRFQGVEGNRVDTCAFSAERQFQMPCANFLGKIDADIGEGEARGGGRLAEGASGGDLGDKFGGCGGWHQGSVDVQVSRFAGACALGGEEV